MRRRRWISAISAVLGGLAPAFGVTVLLLFWADTDRIEDVWVDAFFATPILLLAASVGLWLLQRGHDWHLTGLAVVLFVLAVLGLGAWGAGLVLVPFASVAVAVGSLRAGIVPAYASWVLIATVVAGTTLATGIYFSFDSDLATVAVSLVAAAFFALAWVAIGRTLWAHPRSAGSRERHVLLGIGIATTVGFLLAGAYLLSIAIVLAALFWLALSRLAASRSPGRG
jgi:hypothetical protein